jgi:sensor histidine kinase YesM
MNPHFIFNSLIAIQNYVYKHKPAEVAGYIANFAKLMRMTLENSRNETITIEKEINMLKYYMELQQLRFPGKFDFEMNVDEKIDTGSILIPPMLSQPFIENAIEHGIMNKTGGAGKITVEFIQGEDTIEMQIVDNGVGRDGAKRNSAFQEAKHQSLATTITQERLDLLNKKGKHKASLDIVDLKNDHDQAVGTKVVIIIPES